MRTFRTDLHIHTVLSPCGGLEMSPVNIVSLANKRELEIIGITDHNSTRHCHEVWRLARNTNLTVLPGCEMTSREEVHCLGLFEDFDALNSFQQFIDQNLILIPHNPKIFGYQVIVDANENILEELDYYLGASLNVSIEEIEQKVHELDGIFIPAHVDRPRNSLFSQLAFLPPQLQVDALQISKLADEKSIREKYRINPKISIVRFSDAHFPDDLGKTYTTFNLEEPTFAEIRKALKGEDGRSVKV
jgi:hypothetical protein